MMQGTHRPQWRLPAPSVLALRVAGRLHDIVSTRGDKGRVGAFAQHLFFGLEFERVGNGRVQLLCRSAAVISNQLRLMG
jgi:hypothetical protein